jgi:prophage antirepressor-like protein
MVEVKVMRYEGEAMRMVPMDDRWWVFAQDAARQIDARKNWEMLFTDAPDEEKRFASVTPGHLVRLVSARYLIRRLNNSQNYAHARYRTWLEAWKIVSGAKDLSGSS